MGHIIIFSESLAHNEVAELVGGKAEVESAGQVSVSIDYEDHLLIAFGGSLTLGIKSNPDDTNRIIDQLSVYH